MLSKINSALYKYYFLTWVFVLILFKRSIPKWMHKRSIEILDLPVVMPEVEKYVR